MKSLTRKEKQALANLLSVGGYLSNIAFNIGQKAHADATAAMCKDFGRQWDSAYSQAKPAIRKLQLPTF